MWSLYAVQRLSASTASGLCTLLLPMRVRTVCVEVEAEQKNAKLKDQILGLLHQKRRYLGGPSHEGNAG